MSVILAVLPERRGLGDRPWFKWNISPWFTDGGENAHNHTTRRDRPVDSNSIDRQFGSWRLPLVTVNHL